MALTQANLPVWQFYNEFDDARGVAEFNRSMQHALIEAGGSPIVTQYPALYHNCWDRAYRTPALYVWLMEQNRQANRADRERFRLVLPGPAFDGWTTSQPVVWNFDAEGALIGVAASPAEPSTLVSDEVLDNFDFHFEFQYQRSTACCILFHANRHDGILNAWKVDIPLASHGSGGILDPDRRWKAGIDPLAQRSLRDDRWNDVRIRVRGRQFTLHLNGMRAAEFHDESLLTSRGGIGLVSPVERETRTRWRWMRTRPLMRYAEESADVR